MAGISLSRRAIALIVAVVLAAVATVALVSYVQSAHNKNVPNPTTVYVAKQLIPAQTDAATILSKGLIETEVIDKSVVPLGAIGSLNDIQGKVAAIDIQPKEIILDSRFISPSQVGSTPGAPLLQIPNGRQAISVEVSTIPGVANFIQVGDKISVIAQLALPTGATVRYLLQDIQVLQVGVRVIVPPANGQPGGAAVSQTSGKVDLTLAVTPQEAEKLVFANNNGSLYLTLVHPTDRPVNTPGRTIKSEFGR